MLQFKRMKNILSKHLTAIGKKGGLNTAKRGADYYSKLSKKSWEVRRARAAGAVDKKNKAS